MLLKMMDRLRRSSLAFPLAALAAFAMFAITEASYRDAVRSLDELGEMASTRQHIESLWRNLIDAETGQRGYLPTGRP